MCRGIYAALVIAAMITTGVDAQRSDHNVKKTIELTRRDGKLEFVERGKDSTEPVTIVVGDSIRWENKDNEPHTVMSALTIDGRPLFDTGVIKPGEYVDLLFDIDLYERAGGKPANVVTLKFHSNEQVDEYGELRLLSAARR